MNHRLDKDQKEKLSKALKNLDEQTKCDAWHEAEEAVRKGDYPCTSSEYMYDQFFINTDSPIYVGDK